MAFQNVTAIFQVDIVKGKFVNLYVDSFKNLEIKKKNSMCNMQLEFFCI